MNTAALPPSPVLRKVDHLLSHYGQSHQHPTNEAIHCVAIPVIMLSLVGLLFALHPWVAYAFVAASMVYYARLGSWVLMAIMVFWSALLLVLIRAMGAQVFSISLGLFVIGWIAQFVGHKLEGKKPSFFEDIQYLWVGPLFVLTRFLPRLGIKW